MLCRRPSSLAYAGLFFACLAISGCASLPKCADTLTIDESAGRVVVYRQAAVMGFATLQPVAINDCKLGTLSNGGYIEARLPSGEYQIAILNDFGKPRNPQPIQIRSGEDLYLRWSFEVQDIYVVGSTAGATGSDTFTPVTREIAVAELDKIGELD